MLFKSLTLYFSVLLAAIGALNLCPEGRDYYQGRCYHVVESLEDNWRNSELGCRQFWDDMFEPRSDAEIEHVKSLLADASLTRYWVRASSNSDGGSRCAYLDAASGWALSQTDNCNDIMGAICTVQGKPVDCTDDTCFFATKDWTEHSYWSAAQDDCVAQGGNLAEIDSVDVEDFIKTLIIDSEFPHKKYPIWVGAAYKDGQWAWSQSGDPVEDWNWATGEPNGTDDYCAALQVSSDYKAVSLSCSDTLSNYLCQIPNTDEVSGLIG